MEENLALFERDQTQVSGLEESHVYKSPEVNTVSMALMPVLK